MDMIREHGGRVEFQLGVETYPRVEIFCWAGAWSVYSVATKYQRRICICAAVTQRTAMKKATEALGQ